jgi:shikimate kinase
MVQSRHGESVLASGSVSEAQKAYSAGDIQAGMSGEGPGSIAKHRSQYFGHAPTARWGCQSC